jgi:hypothetical protein
VTRFLVGGAPAGSFAPRIDSTGPSARARELGSLIGAGILIGALVLPTKAGADPWCDTCVSEAPVQIAASSREERNRERSRQRAEDRRDRKERNERRDARRTGRKKLYGIERQLRKEERKGRDSRRDHNPQAGAHCMYGADGKLIHAPRGSYCPATNDEPPAAAGGAPAGAPAQTGCVSGDCRNGRGVFVWKSGSRYVGEFKAGKQHGQGSLAYASGASYGGGWELGKRAGSGTAVYPDGRVESGNWAENKLVRTGAGAATVAVDWPDLTKPASKTGGGKHDAAVVIGLESYAHVGKIPGAAENATDWYKYLVKSRGIPTDRVTLLLDEDATREEMQIAAENAANTVGKKGSLWFVFVGHGAASPDGKDGLLIGFDAQQRARSITARSLKRAELIETLEDSRAKHVNVLLDACFSGRQQNGAQLVAGLQPLIVTSETPTSDPRTTLMTAARSDQYAGPLPGAARPAFSYLMLGGLRGWADADGDGGVGATELHGYVAGAMRSLIRGRSQDPTLTGGEGIRLVKSAQEEGPDIADLVVGSAGPAATRAR